MTRTSVVTVTIHDCRVDTFRAGGKGGQNQNKVSSGVRVVHHPSGAVGESRETRSQLENKRRAFVRMGKSSAFQAWAKLEAAKRLSGVSIDEIVDEQMAPEHLKVEVRDDSGKWVVS